MSRSSAARRLDRTPGSAPERPPLTRSMVWLFTVMGAFVVANLYYNQPLLAEIGQEFGAGRGSTGLVSTLTQAGYALGLFLFVPLADVREHRSLIMVLLVCVSAALAGVALAPTLPWLVAASFVLGLTTVVPQIIIPFAAGLAEPSQRGRVVGQVVGGLLIGILGARTVAGLLGDALGWRWVFGLASGMMLVLAMVAWRAFPRVAPGTALPYRSLLVSMFRLLRAERVLGEVALKGGFVFAAFSAFWTTLAFNLEAPPLHYGPRAAGMFGLVGIVGAMAAPLVGRLTDKRDRGGHGRAAGGPPDRQARPARGCGRRDRARGRLVRGLPPVRPHGGGAGRRRDPAGCGNAGRRHLQPGADLSPPRRVARAIEHRLHGDVLHRRRDWLVAWLVGVGALGLGGRLHRRLRDARLRRHRAPPRPPATRCRVK
jgi:predicted MFS family arabinose efflux permease